MTTHVKDFNSWLNESEHDDFSNDMKIKKEIIDLIKEVGTRGTKMRDKEEHYYAVSIPENTLHLTFTAQNKNKTRFNTDVQSIFLVQTSYDLFNGIIFAIYGYGSTEEVRGTDIEDNDTLESIKSFLETIRDTNGEEE